jgi:hypothetical protein
MENLIVVHMKDGAIHKGITHDFDPSGDSFHLLLAEGGGVPLKIQIEKMKALFYVRDYIGNRDFVARKQFDDAQRADRRAILTFNDGEEIWGTLGEGSDDETGPGFFFFPVDSDDNNIRIFVIRSSLKSLKEVTN